MNKLKCVNPYCNMIINKTEIIEHLKTHHPNMYKLKTSTWALKHGGTLNFRTFFKRVNKK